MKRVCERVNREEEEKILYTNLASGDWFLFKVCNGRSHLLEMLIRVCVTFNAWRVSLSFSCTLTLLLRTFCLHKHFSPPTPPCVSLYMCWNEIYEIQSKALSQHVTDIELFRSLTISTFVCACRECELKSRVCEEL